MNVNMERASFTSLLEHSQFGAPLQVPQQPLMHPSHAQAQPAFGLQGMVSQPMSMGAPQFKQQPAPAPVKLPADQSVSWQCRHCGIFCRLEFSLFIIRRLVSLL